VKAWRRVGSDIEKLFSPSFFTPHIGRATVFTNRTTEGCDLTVPHLMRENAPLEAMSDQRATGSKRSVIGTRRFNAEICRRAKSPRSKSAERLCLFSTGVTREGRVRIKALIGTDVPHFHLRAPSMREFSTLISGSTMARTIIFLLPWRPALRERHCATTICSK
jgi:hypothetical protein